MLMGVAYYLFVFAAQFKPPAPPVIFVTYDVLIIYLCIYALITTAFS